MSFSEHHFSDLARLIFFRLWLNYKQSCLIDIWLKVNYSRKKISLIEWLCVIEAKFVAMASQYSSKWDSWIRHSRRYHLQVFEIHFSHHGHRIRQFSWATATFWIKFELRKYNDVNLIILTGHQNDEVKGTTSVTSVQTTPYKTETIFE